MPCNADTHHALVSKRTNRHARVCENEEAGGVTTSFVSCRHSVTTRSCAPSSIQTCCSLTRYAQRRVVADGANQAGIDLAHAIIATQNAEIALLEPLP